ncbi:hypothetical protein ACFY4B_25385 [Kitasatospora sp. NPDC001261]|uniref:hypothetical protein n=1 Tax=Kitasatospora sp. NPDC001261 TaxID=3364012 RepID=UPI0036959DD9
MPSSANRPLHPFLTTARTWTGTWVAQLAAPSAERIDAGDHQILVDHTINPQAHAQPDGHGGWTVTQRGPLPLWGHVEDAIESWQAVGAPHQDHLSITVAGDGQRAWFSDEDGPSWRLPV